MSEPGETYATIREILGSFVGKRLVDIAQHDEDEWEESHSAYIDLMFEDGSLIRFWQGDEGFQHFAPGEYDNAAE